MMRLQEVMGLLGGSFAPGDAPEVESILRELQGANVLLPLKEVTIAPSSHSSPQASLQSHPKQFRQCLEAALIRSVLLTQAEVEAKGRAIDAVVQLLQQASSRGALRVAGSPVTIDRFAVSGSVGKGVSVQDGFDIDLVAFVNIPAAAGISIDLASPDVTHNSEWMRRLQQQIIECLGKLPNLTGEVRRGRTAISFDLSVLVPESGDEIELEVDVLLAPNLAAGAGAAAAAAWGVRDGEPADMQCRAVLAHVVALADREVRAIAARPRCIASTDTRLADVSHSYARNIWLTEAATEFVQQAALAAADSGRLSGRVVTSTIRVVKAWVRRGLQQQELGYKELKSFTIELIVLHAAQTFGSRQQAIGVSRDGYGGRYVLDLLLEVLAVLVEWANAYEASPSEPTAAAFPAPKGLMLFTEMVGGKYYSSQQAQALWQLGLFETWSGYYWQASVKPIVVHPVDPFINVFASREGRRFELWGVLRHEALQLLAQLKQYSWEEIMQHSTLGRALAPTL